VVALRLISKALEQITGSFVPIFTVLKTVEHVVSVACPVSRNIAI
jgi:hypothetical protein